MTNAPQHYDVYLSASWKQRTRVRALALRLRAAGYSVYDFTDPSCRCTPEFPPEAFPELFDPTCHVYREYLRRADWYQAVQANRRALERSTVCAMLLPCGIDATADWALAVGLGRITCVVGHPPAGERSPVHLWADAMLDTDDELLDWLVNCLPELGVAAA